MVIQNLLEEILEYLNNMYHTRDCGHNEYCLCPSIYVSDEEPDQVIDKIQKVLGQINVK